MNLFQTYHDLLCRLEKRIIITRNTCAELIELSGVGPILYELQNLVDLLSTENHGLSKSDCAGLGIRAKIMVKILAYDERRFLSALSVAKSMRERIGKLDERLPKHYFRLIFQKLDIWDKARTTSEKTADLRELYFDVLSFVQHAEEVSMELRAKDVAVKAVERMQIVEERKAKKPKRRRSSSKRRPQRDPRYVGAGFPGKRLKSRWV